MNAKLYERICAVIDEFAVEVYVTPMLIKKFIPGEKLGEIKERIKGILDESK